MKKNISILLLTLFICGCHFCSSAYAHCSDNCMHRWHNRCNDYYDDEDYDYRDYCDCCGKHCKTYYCPKCKKYYCGKCMKHCKCYDKSKKEEQKTTKTETKK